MFRFLLSGLLVLACAADALAQTTPPAPATTTHHTTQHTTKKVGVLAPTARPAAVVQRQTAAADPASGKGQGVYAAPGEPVNIKSGATMGYDGPAARRAKTKTATTLTPTPR
jgi:hypothetical protein